jgi:hypothetical protein
MSPDRKEMRIMKRLGGEAGGGRMVEWENGRENGRMGEWEEAVGIATMKNEECSQATRRMFFQHSCRIQFQVNGSCISSAKLIDGM